MEDGNGSGATLLGWCVICMEASRPQRGSVTWHSKAGHRTVWDVSKCVREFGWKLRNSPYRDYSASHIMPRASWIESGTDDLNQS